ncbi:MSEP-CTERM sorting domain-containing protein [Hymenobacter crusticola]|uniref:MSEP-CTERM sorting domain-containing protein n=1 Tax=Hymenobacter crusticola TaxID=1770526 RepID=A0A243WBL8_9BACT|nr:MSEP-CTERM sorting domain-containing protein [Hymenobacter crusticola]OUJ72909.1 MSEP-CTERM sorting domain-containing protein [Hymenobacter crusticola]
MRHLLNPNWVFGLAVLPVLVLISLLSAQYQLIKSLLPPESVMWWQSLGVTVVLLVFLQASYAGWCRCKQQALPKAYGAITVVVYVGFLYVYASHIDTLFPRTIANWMLFDVVPLYPVTFLMPTLAHATLVLIIWYTPEEQPHKAGPTFLGALAVPVVWYLVLQVVLPLWRGSGSKFGEHVLVVALVAGTVIFLFLLARGVYILGVQRAGIWIKCQLVWKVLIGIVLPLLGLLVNNGVLFSPHFGASTGIFGNFTSPWFYGLALLNGILLCLPVPRSAGLHLVLYLGRGLTLAYTLYFFLVFLPFLPLSIVAVVAVGTGFLLLTPSLLLLVQLRELTNDYAVLRAFFAKGWLVAGLLLSSLVLPAVITLSYWHQRQVLNQTLAYLYHPDYKWHYELDTTALATTLEAVRHHKSNNADVLFGTHLPYLSTYYNWLVLDNLTLSNEKLDRIEQVFFGALPSKRMLLPWPRTNVAEQKPRLTRLRSHSTYNTQQGAWVSWVDLEITNPAGNSSQAEFATTLALPVGCWVSGCYLYVGRQRVKGLLTEKKAATWVFSQIKEERKDPGILYYTGANEVTLRVFPFAAPEVRRTGIQFLHKEPVTLQVAGQRVTLGNTNHTFSPTPVTATSQSSQVNYISAQQKARLPLVTRKPVFHFLLDVSAQQAANQGSYSARVDAFMQHHHLEAAHVQFSLVDAYVTPIDSSKAWKRWVDNHHSTGGFYLAGALQRLLVDAATVPRPTYPVIVVATDSLNHAVLNTDFSEYAAAYPESDLFYVLGPDGKVEAHSLRNRPLDAVDNAGFVALTETPVRAWPTAQRPRAYLPDDGQASLVLPTTDVDLTAANLAPGSWHSALLLHGHWLAQVLHPATSEPERTRAVRGSFRAGILTPLTAYMVVENEAQRAVLRRKQEQVLAGNDALDLGEETQRMTEPGEIVLLLVLAGGLLMRWGRTRYRLGKPV